MLPEMKEYNTRAMQSPYRRDSEAGDTENNNLQQAVIQTSTKKY